MVSVGQIDVQGTSKQQKPRHSYITVLLKSMLPVMFFAISSSSRAGITTRRRICSSGWVHVSVRGTTTRGGEAEKEDDETGVSTIFEIGLNCG